MTKLRITSRMLTVALATSMIVGVSARAHGDDDPRIVKIDHRYHGLTYGEWEARWWQWADLVPILNGNDHPLFTGDPGDVLRGNSGDVWFLAGVFGVETRRITIPEGTALFFPIVNAECSAFEAPPFHGGNEAERRACANGWIDTVKAVTCTIDGDKVHHLKDYRTESPQFTMGPFPADNILGAPAGSTTPSVDAGIYLLIEPLSEGQHTIHFTANLDWAPFCVGDCIDTTYVITVEHDQHHDHH